MLWLVVYGVPGLVLYALPSSPIGYNAHISTAHYYSSTRATFTQEIVNSRDINGEWGEGLVSLKIAYLVFYLNHALSRPGYVLN